MGVGESFDLLNRRPICPNYLRDRNRDISVEKYADLFGLRYFELNDEKSAAEVLSLFFAEKDRPAILAVHTPNVYNAEVLRGYFRRSRQ